MPAFCNVCSPKGLGCWLSRGLLPAEKPLNLPFPRWFISASVQYYCKLPDHLEDRVSIVVDPMLATGNSSAAAVALLKQAGARQIRFLCLLAAPEGIARMKAAHPDVPIVTAAVDSHLNDHGYIVPGLGDAGDRMFGTK